MTEKTQAEHEYEEQERKHTALLATLTIPEGDNRGTYANRQLQAQWVKTREHQEGGDWYAITGTSGWTAGCSKEVFDLLTDGKPYILETRGFSQITGWIIDGEWYDHKTDEELDAAHAKWLADWERKKIEELEKHREDWQRRQDALPVWLRSRLETFHEKSDGKFASEGWGYELIVAELAIEYAALGEVILDKDVFSISEHESETIKKISSEQGTSGNQHGVALALAKAHLQDPERNMAGTVSALAPLTGDAFYEGN